MGFANHCLLFHNFTYNIIIHIFGGEPNVRRKTPMTQVFISYSRRDLAFVEQLAADLQAAGLDVWYYLSGLEGGVRWRIEIEKAIRASQYLLIVLSPDSVVSEWVEREYLFASNLRRLFIFFKNHVTCLCIITICTILMFKEKNINKTIKKFYVH